MKARVFVTLKRGVLDPQGKAVCTSLHQLGYREVTDVRIGKTMEITLGGLVAGDVREAAGQSGDRGLPVRVPGRVKGGR